MQDKYLTPQNFFEHGKRLRQLKSDAQPSGGGPGPLETLRHFRKLLEISLEERSVRDRGNLATRSRLYRRLMIRQWGKIDSVVAPLSEEDSPEPKKPRPPKRKPGEEPPPEPDPFDAELEAVEAAMRRFGKAVHAKPDRRTPSPNLGKIPLTYWALIHGLHLERIYARFGL